MLEDIKILTGSPSEVKPKLAEYLASHPKARIQSSAITVSHPPAAADKDGKAKEAPKPVITLCVIVAKEF